MRDDSAVRSFGVATVDMTDGKRGRALRRANRPAMLAVLAMVLSMVMTLQVGSSKIVSAAAVNSLSSANFQVKSDDGTTPITSFKYVINLDNTGTNGQREPADGCSPEDPNYQGFSTFPDKASSCKWTSMGVASSSPVVTQGTDTDFAGGGFNLPDGRYLISVLADGYKLDGAHFTMPLSDTDMVTVLMSSTDPGLPTAMIQAAVFEDISPVNSGPDLPAEHGLAGFTGLVKDTLGTVTTDVFGGPLCGNGVCLSYCYVVDGGVDLGMTAPDADGRCPTVNDQGDPSGLTYLPWNSSHPPFPSNAQIAGGSTEVPSTAAIEGKIKIPDLGTNRFTLSVTPPDGSNFIQTTTLEGNHDWDSWIMEGVTGLDTEFTVAGEPFPAIIFGYTPETHHPYDDQGVDQHGVDGTSAGSITGIVEAVKIYVPTNGGTTQTGEIWGGLGGGKLDKPLGGAWVSLTDLNNGDTMVWTGQADANGKFTIKHVPDGLYTVTYWDDPQDYILDLQNVTIVNGEQVDMGLVPLQDWWTVYSGYVFNDTNRNGKMDWTDTNGNGCPDVGEGELGVPNYTLTLRRRDNTLMDRGTTVVGTDPCGYYYLESAYPMTQWLVLEAYNDLYYTTGVTYQADNQPTPTTVQGAGVDVSVLPIIGLSGTMDWGVHSYDPAGVTNGADPRNGGIVGTVSYDTTRNELDPRYAAVEDWQPGVSGLTVDLYAPIDCGTNVGVPCDAAGLYELAADGSYAQGNLLNNYVTETWEMPGKNGDGICIPRDVDGNELTYPDKQQITNPRKIVPNSGGKTEADLGMTDCLEAPLMGTQFQNGFSTVDGNYGFGGGCQDPAFPFDAGTGLCTDGSSPDDTPLAGGQDYLVHVEMPNDPVHNKPLYNFTREEDINIGNGDNFVPAFPPPACVGPLHIVDNAGIGANNYPARVGTGVNGLPVGVSVPASTPTDNATFNDIGGSPYEGQATPLCNTKLVTLNNGRSIVPTFNVFTDVPIPGRFWGLVVDDLNFSSDPKQINYGEKAGVPFAPVGIYDFKNRLVYNTESDYGGLFDVLMPSTNRINCPTPSGVCANVYSFVGNDPGQPGSLNANYKPDYRTIAAEFEALPGVLIPADLAPTQVGVVVQVPGGQAITVQCNVSPITPQLFAVDKPYVNDTGDITIQGVGFGAVKGTGSVTLGGTAVPTTSWSDTAITFHIGSGVPAGPQQLLVTNNYSVSTVNGLTFHVLRGSTAAPFPSTPVLDTFPLLSGNGPNWSVTSSRVSQNSGTLRFDHQFFSNWILGAYWTTSFGADQEAYATITSASNVAQSVDLKATDYSGSTGIMDQGIRILRTGSNVQLQTLVHNQTAVTRATYNVVVGMGHKFGARASSNGDVTVYVDGVALGAPVNVVGLGWSSSLASGGGRIGLASSSLFSSTTRFDNFGGGNASTASSGIIYQPNLFEVGAGHTYATIQSAIDAAQAGITTSASTKQNLVVVYPGTPDLSNPRNNPRGAYYENLIVNSPIKIQGVGPGGVRGTETVPGSIIDGGAFGGDGVTATNWYTAIAGIVWSGNQTVNDGAVVSVFGIASNGVDPIDGTPLSANLKARAFTADFTGAIDGFDIRGGDQQGFPGNLNAIGGGSTGLPANVQTQGGAVFANSYAKNLQITNNMVQNNGGGFGTIRIGTPDVAAAENHNENVNIAHNRIIQNAGTNLAGGIGLFNGSDNYRVADNDICGNFSAEYGGGLTAYGYSPNGVIDHNRIWFNRSYDEGGGIMIAGTLPAATTSLSPGSGPVTISRNLIQANLGNDDGGGLRFLMAGGPGNVANPTGFQMDVFDNIIVNNVSTHEGGGVALNDTPNVLFYNNTVMKNITTATALTSAGDPAPAGLSTSRDSDLIHATMPTAPVYSTPKMFNNIFSDNRAGSRDPAGITGLGTGGPGDIDVWDAGVADMPGMLNLSNSMYSASARNATSLFGPANQIGVDPHVVAPYDTVVSFNAWRTNPNFIAAILVSLDLPPELLGNYHLASPSPAENVGAASLTGTNAPGDDIDRQARSNPVDIGADEVFAGTVIFPTTPLIDNFNRTTTGGLGMATPGGGTWAPGGASGYSISGNTLSAASGTNPALVYLNNRGRSTTFGANQEVQFTFASTPDAAVSTKALLLKVATGNSSMIVVNYDQAGGQVTVSTVQGGLPAVQRGALGSVSFAANDSFGARASADGTVTVYKNGVVLGTVSLTGWPTYLINGGGRIGVQLSGTGTTTIDNFTGGTVS